MGNASEASPDYIMQMEAAGLLIAGKTNTPQFASLPATDNEVSGKNVESMEPGLFTRRIKQWVRSRSSRWLHPDRSRQ